MNKIATLVDKELFEIKNLPLKELNTNYVRVKNLYCGICGGDYSKYIGNRNKYNISLGHEFISEVVEVGENVKEFQIGDLVVSDINFRCGECYYCKNNNSHLCDSVDIELLTNRGFAHYSDYHYSYLVKVNKLSNNIVSGVNVEPLSCVIHALSIFNFQSFQSICVVGLGNIGSLACFYLSKCLNIDNIYVYDVNNKKQSFITENFTCLDYDENITYDFIFEASDSIDGLLLALNIAKKGSPLCSMSHLYGVNTSSAYDLILKKEINISFPLRNGEQQNLIDAYNFIFENWNIEYNSCFELYNLDYINIAFKSKKTSSKNKQIISLV